MSEETLEEQVHTLEHAVGTLGTLLGAMVFKFGAGNDTERVSLLTEAEVDGQFGCLLERQGDDWAVIAHRHE